MGGKVAALQAHCSTLEGEAERWQHLWRQAAASNAHLTQRLQALQKEHGIASRPSEVGTRISRTPRCDRSLKVHHAEMPSIAVTRKSCMPHFLCRTAKGNRPAQQQPQLLPDMQTHSDNVSTAIAGNR